MRRKIITVIFTLMVAIPVLCISFRLLQYVKADLGLKETAEITASYVMQVPENQDTRINSVNPEDFIDITGLRTENPDVTGYVRVDGTGIDYPVMKNEDPDKYLYAGFDGEYAVYGSIFMDNACYEGAMNTVLYGHNMKSGKMFAPLKNYLNPEYKEAHPIIKYIDEHAISLYRICAVFSAPAGDDSLIKCLVPYTEDEMEQLRGYVDAAGGTVHEDFGYGDQLITLATCEYTHKDGRLFVIGKLSDRIGTGGDHFENTKAEQ